MFLLGWRIHGRVAFGVRDLILKVKASGVGSVWWLN